MYLKAGEAAYSVSLTHTLKPTFPGWQPWSQSHVLPRQTAKEGRGTSCCLKVWPHPTPESSGLQPSSAAPSESVSSTVCLPGPAKAAAFSGPESTSLSLSPHPAPLSDFRILTWSQASAWSLATVIAQPVVMPPDFQEAPNWSFFTFIKYHFHN